jgi:argininosuccinate lyase
MADSGYLGAGGRLAGGPAAELVEAGYAREIGHARRLARGLSLADLAHAVALVEGGGLDAARGARLLGGLLELDAIAPDDFPWDPALGDAFNSREAELERRIGPDAAGWLSAGRPRREAFRVALRLVARDGAVDLHDALLQAAGALAAHAEAHRDDLAADYTYLQPAQPTTVGHLLLTYAFPLVRDAERLRGCHVALSRSVAGVGGSAGSRWPLDRRRLAELLGCDEVEPHAKDAMWQADPYVELLAAIAMQATHLSQLGQDFEIYASQEFGLVELADRHSRASALMPQKKNPYALAVIRTQAGQAAGDVAAALTTLHTGSARTDHFHLLNGLVPRALAEAIAVGRLAAAVLEGLEVDVERLGRVAREGFTSMADVSDVLAMTTGLDYRRAHKIVGRAVRDLRAAGGTPADLTPARIAEAAEAVTGEGVQIDAEVLADALDPLASARARLQEGSSSPEAMAELLRLLGLELRAGQGWSEQVRGRVELATAELLDEARELAAGG